MEAEVGDNILSHVIFQTFRLLAGSFFYAFLGKLNT